MCGINSCTPGIEAHRYHGVAVSVSPRGFHDVIFSFNLLHTPRPVPLFPAAGCTRFRDMAVVSARNMVHAMGFSERSGMGGLALGNGGSASDISVNDSRAHDPVPSFSSKFLGLSWR